MLKVNIQCLFVAVVIVSCAILAGKEGQKAEQKNLKISLSTGKISGLYYSKKVGKNELQNN